MKTKYVYIALCFLGTILPFSQFIPWVMQHGVDIPLMVQELFSTRIGGFFGLDVIVSALVLVLFIVVECRRLQMKISVMSILATFSIGVSLGLPLFLYLRQVHLEGIEMPG